MVGFQDVSVLFKLGAKHQASRRASEASPNSGVLNIRSSGLCVFLNRLPGFCKDV